MIEWIDPAEELPTNEEGRWSEEVLCLADNFEFYKLSHMGGHNGCVWQRTQAFIDQGATKVIAWSHINWPDEE